jgi:hypothetical protein
VQFGEPRVTAEEGGEVCAVGAVCVEDAGGEFDPECCGLACFAGIL